MQSRVGAGVLGGLLAGVVFGHIIYGLILGGLFPVLVPARAARVA